MANNSGRQLAEFVSLPVYDYYMFGVEKYYEDHLMRPVMDWLDVYWPSGLVFCVLYVVAIFSIKSNMEHRPKHDLRLPLAIWSTFLAVFSFLGMIRSFPELTYILDKYGYRHSVCNPSYMWGPTGMWQILMVLSKIVELGDTIFIVLRKQQLIFLHWYHHMTVLLYGFYSFSDPTAPGRWFVTMNFSVHSVMYTYYALRAMRFSVPKFVNIIITSSQIMQMMVGMLSVIMVATYKSRGHPCSMSKNNVFVALAMYFSYFVLFAQFFYHAYLKPKSHKENGLSNGKKLN